MSLYRAPALAVCLLLVAQLCYGQDGQYRSKIRITPDGGLGQGAGLSVEELEQQINSIADPYAKSSAGRHLARHYVEQAEYGKAIEYYREALAAKGLSDIANREMLRELAQVYLLSEDYSAAASTLERALKIDLVPDVGDYLLLAQAYYRLGNYVQVVAALDHIAEKNLPLMVTQQRQALALYYQAGAYAQCEVLLRQLLDAQPDNPENWHQLASIYLQQGKKKKALDQLVLAQEKAVPFREQEIILLADLQAVNGNPYGAAQTLADALTAQTVEPSGAHYRKLFEFWLTAREKEKATVALNQAARRTGDTQLFLYLAQLQMEQESWQPMHQTMLTACANQLQDKHVGRANLLLGISQLKLADEQGARRSFINATLIGGATRQAGEWLAYMDAEPATKRELQRIVGICYGSEDKQGSVAAIGAGEGSAAAAGSVDSAQGDVPAQATLAIKTVEALRLFYLENDLPLAELASKMKSLAIRMSVALVKSGGAVDGPLQIISLGNAQEGAKLQLAFPVKGSPRAGRQFKIRQTEDFNCAFLVHTGKMEELAAVVGNFEQAIIAQGHQLSGERRLLFSNSRGGGQIEVQIGLR